MASEQKGLKIDLREAGNKVRVSIFCRQYCLRLLNIGNTFSYPYTHSIAQESHFCCPCSKEAWHFAGSNNNKSLELRGRGGRIRLQIRISLIQIWIFLPGIWISPAAVPSDTFIHYSWISDSVNTWPSDSKIVVFIASGLSGIRSS